MSTINDLINFLRLGRRDEETAANSPEIDQTKVYATIIDTNEKRVIERVDFDEFRLYERIVGVLDKYGATHFYILPLSGKRIFYIKIPLTSDGYNYLNLESSKSELVPDETLLQPIEIDFATTTYFYDKQERAVIHIDEILENTTVFSDSIFFDPEKVGIQTGSYNYHYSKPVSALYQFFSSLFSILKNIIGSLFLPSGIISKDVEITVRKKGTIYLIPAIRVINEKDFHVQYYYTSSGKKMFYQINELEDVAISLKFNEKTAFLSYLNETIFTQKSFNYNDAFEKPRRIEFIESFKTEIIAPLQRKIMNGTENDFREAMVTLYYLTDDVAFSLNNECLWRLFEIAVQRDNLVNTQRMAEENIFIKLLKIIAEKETSKVAFLQRMLQKTDKTTYLELLYNGLDGENNITFIKLIHHIWKASLYSDIDPETNRLIDGPVLLDYRSNKKLGFHTDNASIDWKSDSALIDVDIDIKVGEHTHTTYGLGTTANTQTEDVIVTHHYAYHPFAPIVIINADNPTFILKDKDQENKPFTILPAFVLYASKNKAFWENVMTAAEYTLDIATTLSGVGNILKVGRLARIISAGHSLIGRTKTATTIIAGVEALAGAVEVSSGAGNALMKLLDVNDTELGREIAVYLFYLEILSLSGELSVAVHEGLKKSAKEILAKEDILRRSAKNADEVEEVEELIEHLDEVGELDFLAKWDDLPVSRKGYLGGKTLRRREIKYWSDEITRISNGKSQLIVLPKGHKKLQGNQAGFDPFTGNIYVQKGLTEYEIFHEFQHLEEYIKLGKNEYLKGIKRISGSLEEDLIRTYKREKYVFDKIMGNKNKFNKAQLDDAQDYIDRIIKKCSKAGIDITKIK